MLCYRVQSFFPSLPSSTFGTSLRMATGGDKMNYAKVRKSVDQITAENFDSTISLIEPFLLNEAGATFYRKTMKNVAWNAKRVGKELSNTYALDAKATLKRRNKQDAFIKSKEEERIGAEEAKKEAEEAAAAEEVSGDPPKEEPAEATE